MLRQLHFPHCSRKINESIKYPEADMFSEADMQSKRVRTSIFAFFIKKINILAQMVNSNIFTIIKNANKINKFACH